MAKGWEGFDPNDHKRRWRQLPPEVRDVIISQFTEQHPEFNPMDVKRGPKTVFELWDSLIKSVAPGGDPNNFHPTQLQEMRRMFYRGFAGCLDIALMIGDNAVSEDQGVEYLSSLHDECKEFMDKMLAGEA